jgi:poly(hydroxyalkanoate) depolymerase family esterase
VRVAPFAYRLPVASGRLSSAFKSALEGISLSGRPRRVASFGSNPGELRMLVYAPARLRPGRPLVIVLHGCGQNAALFASDAGWIALAQQYRLALVMPEQTHANNRGRCFNWFRPHDVQRGSGEAMSIRQMVRSAAKQFGSDPRQIYIVGFSAGGGMAAALLAAYPSVFAAGGVFAGMPVGCAHSAIGAVTKMRRADTGRSRAALAKDVRGTGRTRKSWPRLAIWQGERDHTVDPKNAEVLAAQWSELHGLGPVPATSQTLPGMRRRSWGKANKPPSVDLWTLAQMGHGFPVDPGVLAGGRVGAWVVDAGISGAQTMAAFWGLKRPRS